MLKRLKYSYQRYSLPLQPVTLQNPVRYHPQDLLPLPEGLGLGFLKTSYKCDHFKAIGGIINLYSAKQA
jgi:hypothetical protein